MTQLGGGGVRIRRRRVQLRDGGARVVEDADPYERGR